MFKGRLITLFIPPHPQPCGRGRFVSSRGRQGGKKSSLLGFLFVGADASQVLATGWVPARVPLAG